MVVIADCSPLNYLILLGAVDVLPVIFGQIQIPEAVAQELLRGPDEGEKEAIALAIQHGNDALLLIDESKGRREAARIGVRVMGTLGILDMAAERRLIELPSIIDRLRKTSFYVKPALLKALLERHRLT